MFRILTIALLLAGAAWTSFADVEWKNLDEAHRKGGRRISAGYLQGKIVLVCRDAALHSQMAEIWESYKTKPFVILGSYSQLPEDGSLHPVYADAGIATGEPNASLYIVDETGKVIYYGKDDHVALQVIVTSLTDFEYPRNLKQWKHFIDYELEHLPGHAYNRLKSFNRAFHAEAQAYRENEKVKELVKIPDIKAAAEFLAFAKMAKDPRSFNSVEVGKQERYEKLLETALTGPKYTGLRDRIKDERLLREVKNAFADLKWTHAEL